MSDTAAANVQSENRKLIADANALAREFYAMQGCEVSDDFKFYEAHHPAEIACWEMAVLAYEHISATAVDDCLACLEDDDQ